MKTYVLYHGNCPDGFAAAMCAWGKLGDDATYVPVSYGQAPPAMEPGSNIYILDFSYPREVILSLRELHERVRIVDHHKTAQDALSGLPDCVFDMSHSGAVLAWAEFFPDKPTPPFLEYIEDRDLWRWKLPRSKEISATLGVIPRTFEEWWSLVVDKRHLVYMAGIGVSILQFKTQQVETAAAAAKLERFDGLLVPVVNASCFFSETCDRLLELYPDAPFAVAWFVNKDHFIQYSLRSRPGFDVSVVAKRYGGGGHAQAAGCQQPWADQHLPEER